MIESLSELTTPLARDLVRASSDPGVIIVDGYDVRLVVRQRMLEIHDGIRTGRRARKVSRADNIKRILILSDTGMVTFDALRWCEYEGIAIAQYERTGHLIMLSGPSHDEAHIKQAQAIASAGGLQAIRLETARRLLTAKLEGQSRNALDILHQPEVSYLIDEHLRGLGKASTLKEMSGYEGNAALAYWNAWTNHVHVPFPPEATLNLPIHWSTYRGRPSGTRLAGGSKRRNRTLDSPESANRGATDPINTMLNYAYRVAETEAKLACLAHGLDPGIGFMHLIESDREAMALDLVEAARPICDAIVLSFLDTGLGVPYENDKPRYFDPGWCYEIRHGVVRLQAPLTQMLAERCLDMGRAIEPHVRELALTLSNAKISDLSVMQAGKSSITDVRTRNARIAAYHPLQRMPVPNDAREVITDEQWEKIRVHVPIVKNLMGAKRLDDRLVLAAIVYATANGIPLTALPDSLRLHYRTAERRIQEWKSCGAWPRITRAIRASVLPGFSG